MAFSGDGVKNYSKGPPRQVPGFSDLHRMTIMLLAERMPERGRVLVLGAGGGLEMKAMAEAQPDWALDGVDPSQEMLDQARLTVGSHAANMRFHRGTIEQAPPGPFDSAVSLLTFHFIALEERLNTLRQIRQRLPKGAPFVVAHLSFPQSEPARAMWIARHVKFGAPADADPTQIARSCQAISDRLTILPPQEEESMLRAAGFADVSLFYAGMSLRGWVAYAG